MRKTAFLYDDKMADHVLSDTHPMQPTRLKYTYELLSSYGAFNPLNSLLVAPRSATEREVESYHTPEYIRAVREISSGGSGVNPAAHNFGPGDNPPYEGMYDAAMLSTGSVIQAAEMLATDEV